MKCHHCHQGSLAHSGYDLNGYPKFTCDHPTCRKYVTKGKDGGPYARLIRKQLAKKHGK